MKTKILLLIFLFFSGFYSNAQFKSAKVGIDGLTCSMCSNGVERLLLQLDFVESVQMDLNANEAIVYFRNNRKTDFKKVSKKIFDSGFSVRDIVTTLNFDTISLQGNAFYIDGEKFYILGENKSDLSGEKSIRFLDKNLINKKEYSQWSYFIRENDKLHNEKLNAYHICL
jgi:copper chaperone CopZ